MLKINVNFDTLLIGVEGTKTPAGVRGRGDSAGAKSAEEAPRHACGKRSAWNGNQQTSLTQPFFTKIISNNEKHFH
ncbi:hypothetical protein [Bacillus sp. X1(2014)]|uniref:hypothetical protein n=1 Tax=Bacillus sp. X1(2014) TaxID=1565991 RepID=UPI0021B429CE|nr:hypothetical protein [Bacillus sp. X1(2014)]